MYGRFRDMGSARRTHSLKMGAWPRGCLLGNGQGNPRAPLRPNPSLRGLPTRFVHCSPLCASVRSVCLGVVLPYAVRICVALHCAAFCWICVPRRCVEPLNASGRLPRLTTLGNPWAAICPVVRPGRALLVGPRLCAQPVATLHVCSTPHVGGSYTAGYTHPRPRCVPGPPAS